MNLFSGYCIDFDDPQSISNAVADDLTIFVRAVLGADTLPAEVREAAISLEFVSRSTFDQSYLDFLEEQIGLDAREPAWTALLKARLAALTPYRDRLTFVGFVPSKTGLWSVRVDPARQRVIHGEPVP